LSMTYDSSRQALKELGRDARFEDDIGHYNYRRWTANEVNRAFPATRLVLRRPHLPGDKPLLILYLTADHRELYQPGAAEGAWPVWRRGF
jgi:hypothetical protein